MKKGFKNVVSLFFILVIWFFIMAGCSNQSAPLTPENISDNVSPVSSGSFIFSSDDGYIPPYNALKFRPVLDASKLQAPTSSTACPQGEFDGFADWYFYLYQGSDDYMTFKMSGYKHRSELRQMEEWHTTTTTWRKMIGEVKVFYPSSSTMNQFTWMQIHSTATTKVNLPLIRLVWLRSRGSVQDHLWAYVRKSISESIYDVVDLGPRPSGFFRAEVKVINNKLRVLIDYVVKISSMDVSYWANVPSYFKAGVYLQNDGTAKVQFRRLNYYK